MSSSRGLKKQKCTAWAHSVGVQETHLQYVLTVKWRLFCDQSELSPLDGCISSEVYRSVCVWLWHRYLVAACFSENTLRMKLPFLWGWKVEGTMAYSPGGSLKRSHTSRVLMKLPLMATALCRSRTSGPRWTLLRPLSWTLAGEKGFITGMLPRNSQCNQAILMILVMSILLLNFQF